MRTTVEGQIRKLGHEYVRHGSKNNRKKQLNRLSSACRWIADTFRIGDVRQIGRRQIWGFYDAHAHMTYKTLLAYFYAFDLLWQLLERNGSPPRPSIRNAEPNIGNVKESVQALTDSD